MIVLLIAIILIFVPSKVYVSVKVHNMRVCATLRLTLYHVLPLTIKVFNHEDEPLEFFYKLFGKTRIVNKDAAKEKIKKASKQSKKGGKKLLYAMKRILKYIRSLCGQFQLGIRDRADHTAIITGCLNGFFIPALKICPVEKTDIIFIPVYGKDVFDGEITCIITFSFANIIHESIRYLFKRRSIWKTQ